MVNATRQVQQEAGKSKQAAIDANKGFEQLQNSVKSAALQFIGYEAAIKTLSLVKTAVSDSIELGAAIGKSNKDRPRHGYLAGVRCLCKAPGHRAGVGQQGP